ncbi:hypothetical protein CC86DRAFT_427964 [Ophiobolus disseminans]|uniref:Uncharacterized protein n=1 Tax=Ophiobolus disseminans TaxID=1469910 RepID=A0A6A6ZL09_9PLEO|nr:hypothetical protein CC86DRAFT_427964 [Ophiobolus disseminans]
MSPFARCCHRITPPFEIISHIQPRFKPLFSADLQGSSLAIIASSSTLDDHIVTRASIILEKQSDWKLWYSMKKQFATVKGVWDYCNPLTEKQPPTIDDEPSDEATEGAWRNEVNLEIMRTVARSKLHLITELELDVRLRLKTLQDHFKITNQQQVLELSTMYTDVQQKRKNQSISTWLDEYSRIASLCKAEDIAEMKGTRPHCEEDAKDPPTLEGLINRYRRWISTKRVQTSALGSFAAQDATQDTLDITQADKPKRQEKCVCGLDHDALRCFILNPEAKGRPEGYKPHKIGLAKILRAFKNPELLKKVKKLYKDNNICWTFDIAKASAASAASGGSGGSGAPEDRAETHQDRRPNADRIDDSDHSRDYYANTAFHMAQIATPTGSTLLDRWIVDPGSNVHICNSTHFNWVKTADASPTDVVFAGTAAHQVVA